MFYEEKIINGVLHCRTSPDGKWRLAAGLKAKTTNALLSLSEEERKEIFGLFCMGCGDSNPRCSCMKDE